MEKPRGKATYTRMDEMTVADFAILQAYRDAYPPDPAGLALGMLAGLRASEDEHGRQVDRLEHSLQTASRAYREEAGEETVVAALLHDIGDVVAPHNHAAASAEVLRPFVSEETYWMVRHHGIFQAYYFAHYQGDDRNMRERYRGHPCYEKTIEFCDRWDQRAFDPNYDTLPLSAFEPMVRRRFAIPRWRVY